MKLRTLYTAHEIEATVRRLAEEITRDLASLLPAPETGGADSSGLPRYPEGFGDRSGVGIDIAPTLSFERPVLIGLLKGTFVFLADLVRAMNIPVDIDFMRARLVSKGGGPTVQFEFEPQHSLEGRTLVVVEDVAGSGRTLPGVLARLEAHAPRAIRVCSLVRRRGYSGPPIDYVGFDVGPGWLVGYGLDDREALRNLPGLCVLED